jgi:hypothetical protein
MIVDVMNLLGSDSDLAPEKPNETALTLKSSLKHEAPMLFVKQDMHDSTGNLRFRNDLQRSEARRPENAKGNFAQIGEMAESANGAGKSGFGNVASSFVEQVSDVWNTVKARNSFYFILK